MKYQFNEKKKLENSESAKKTSGSDSVVHSAFISDQSEVILATKCSGQAIMMVIKVNVRSSIGTSDFIPLHCLIDTGGYKTSTTKKLFRRLGIDKPRIGSVSISGFGSKSPSEKEVEIANLEFKAVQGSLDSVIIETLGFDHLLGPLTPRNCQFSSNDWEILKELQIEDPPYGEFNGQIDLILGLNAFHKIWMYGCP